MKIRNDNILITESFLQRRITILTMQCSKGKKRENKRFIREIMHLGLDDAERNSDNFMSSFAFDRSLITIAIFRKRV